jgi:hypothetical protein
MCITPLERIFHEHCGRCQTDAWSYGGVCLSGSSFNFRHQGLHHCIDEKVKYFWAMSMAIIDPVSGVEIIVKKSGPLSAVDRMYRSHSRSVAENLKTFNEKVYSRRTRYSTCGLKMALLPDWCEWTIWQRTLSPCGSYSVPVNRMRAPC